MQLPRRPIAPAINKTKWQEYRKTSNTGRNQDITNNFTTNLCGKHYKFKNLSARTVTHHLFPIWHQQVLLIKSLRWNGEKKIQNIKSIHNSKVYEIKWSSVRRYNHSKNNRWMNKNSWQFISMKLNCEKKKTREKRKQFTKSSFLFFTIFGVSLKKVSHKMSTLKKFFFTSWERNWDQYLSSMFCTTKKRRGKN